MYRSQTYQLANPRKLCVRTIPCGPPLAQQALEVELSNVARLLEVANQFSVTGLREQLSEILLSHLDVNNSVSLYMVAEQCACDELQAAAFKKMTDSFATACKTEEFAALDERQLVHIISSDCIIDCDEFVVFEAVSALRSHVVQG
jgi:BTB And C-terminal Kelch